MKTQDGTMTTPFDYSDLAQAAGKYLKFNEPLSRYTVARLGGPADALVQAHATYLLAAAARWGWRNNIPTRILGGGANVLISDLGYRGLIIVNNAKAITFGDDGTVTAESGVVLTPLARLSMSRGLSGLEWAVSVPGTVGGAIVNNAGAHGSEISANLISARIAYPGNTSEHWPVEKLAYSYRESALKRRDELFVVLSGKLKLDPGHEPA